MPKKKYVIGDVHGCSATLYSLLFNVLRISKKDKIYFLGDYVDRGPDSKGVIKLILKLIKDGYSVKCLMGNHEKMLLDSIESEKGHYQWVWNGGSECLKSFEVNRAFEIKPIYLDFIKKLKLYVEVDDFILVHAGLNFNLDNPFKDKKAMLWIRNSLDDIRNIDSKKLIVGHTPTKLKKIMKSLDTQLILLDGGCVYKYKNPKLGNLCALELNSMELYYHENIDM